MANRLSFKEINRSKNAFRNLQKPINTAKLMENFKNKTEKEVIAFIDGAIKMYNNIAKDYDLLNFDEEDQLEWTVQQNPETKAFIITFDWILDVIKAPYEVDPVWQKDDKTILDKEIIFIFTHDTQKEAVQKIINFIEKTKNGK